MNIFDGVNTTVFNDLAWVLAKMFLIFVIAPGLLVGYICKKALKLKPKIVQYIAVLVGALGLFYLLSNIDAIYNWLS